MARGKRLSHGDNSNGMRFKWLLIQVGGFSASRDDSENDRAWRCTDTGRYTKKPAIMRALDVIAKSFTWRY